MGRLKQYLDENKAFLKNSRETITAQNNRTLSDSCKLYAAVLLIYTVFSVASGASELLRVMYYVFDGIHICLCSAVFLRSQRMRESFRVTQSFCILLELSVLSFFMLEGAFASTTDPALYTPIAILLVQLIFMHGMLYSVCMIFLYCSSFALLSYLHKTPAAYSNDLHIAVATFISANIAYVLVTRIRKREQQALERYRTLSKTDMLTGLYNKSALDDQCQAVISGSERACALIVIDLNDFKSVNDTYGHSTGDEVLQKFGDTLRHVFRFNDITGRFGGDEFIVLMDACDDPRVIRERMSELRRRVERLSFSAPELAARYSAGVACRKADDDYRAMFTRADKALYEAKRGEPYQVEFA